MFWSAALLFLVVDVCCYGWWLSMLCPCCVCCSSILPLVLFNVRSSCSCYMLDYDDSSMVRAPCCAISVLSEATDKHNNAIATITINTRNIDTPSSIPKRKPTTTQ